MMIEGGAKGGKVVIRGPQGWALAIKISLGRRCSTARRAPSLSFRRGNWRQTLRSSAAAASLEDTGEQKETGLSGVQVSIRG